MIDIFKLIAAFVAGYLLGSLNTAVIVGKVYGKDISSLGSKSAGLTIRCGYSGRRPRRLFSWATY